MVTKICENCGKEFKVIKCRENTAKYCCRKCSDESKKASNNVICSFCGKPFHLKNYQITKYNRTLGIFCSRECLNEAKKIYYVKEGNHQYGLTGNKNASFKNKDLVYKNHKINDIYVYFPNHPYCSKTGRVKLHRLLVEEHYYMFPIKYFEYNNGWWILKRNIDVHHLDGNHDNNDISNLIPCTKSEHKHYHKTIIIERDKGKILKAAVLK